MNQEDEEEQLLRKNKMMIPLKKNKKPCLMKKEKLSLKFEVDKLEEEKEEKRFLRLMLLWMTHSCL